MVRSLAFFAATVLVTFQLIGNTVECTTPPSGNDWKWSGSETYVDRPMAAHSNIPITFIDQAPIESDPQPVENEPPPVEPLDDDENLETREVVEANYEGGSGMMDANMNSSCATACPDYGFCFVNECVCQDGFSMIHGKCVSMILISCSTPRVTLQIEKSVFDTFGVNSNAVYLNDPACQAKIAEDNNSYYYGLADGIRSCNTTVSENSTWITYTNMLYASSKSKNDVIVTGTELRIPFMCAFPRNSTLSIDYTALLASQVINAPLGIGAFILSMKLYQTDNYEFEEMKRNFSTKDKLYVQVELENGDDSLAVSINKCWATPTSDKFGSIRYDLISDRCPVTEAAAENNLWMPRNGADHKAQFYFQAFAFIRESSIFLHCEINVCDLTTKSCVKECVSPNQPPGSRVKRNERSAKETSITETVGPIYRDEISDSGSNTPSISMIIPISVIVFFVICAVIFAIVAKRKKLSAKLEFEQPPPASDIKTLSYRQQRVTSQA